MKILHASRPMVGRRPLLVVAFLLVMSTTLQQQGVVVAASGGGEDEDDDDGKCSSGTSASYECPNCGGMFVEDCLDCHGYLNTDPKHNICFTRKLFHKYNGDPHDYSEHYHHLWRDLTGMVVWFCAAGVATACGVGGGGIYVPLGIILLNFAPKPSSGLSQASIFGASLGGLILNLRNLHPNTHIKVARTTQSSSKTYTRPLIDYDMALFLAPMEMAGAVLGVLIQKILPNWLYLTLAAIILALTSHKTYKKYFSSRQTELDAAEAAAAIAIANEGEGGGENIGNVDLLVPEEAPPAAAAASADTAPTKDGAKMLNNNGSTTEMSSSESGDEERPLNNDNGNTLLSKVAEEENLTTGQEQPLSPEQVEECHKLLEEDARQYPKEKLAALGVLWVGLILLTFLKGGKGVDSIVGITCQSPWYGVLIAIQFLWTLGFALLYGLRLVKNQRVKDACGYPFLENDVLWDASKLRFYASFTFMAGIVAGLIGIGGGMVLGPLMLVMGIHPRVSSATTATMIVLTSSSVAVLFVTAGLVPWQYAVLFFSTCFSGALVGKTYIDGYVKRTGKASLLIFLLATIIAFATVGCVVIVLMRLAQVDWCLEGFHKFCNVHPGDGDFECPVNRLLFGEQGGEGRSFEDQLFT